MENSLIGIGISRYLEYPKIILLAEVNKYRNSLNKEVGDFI